VRISASGIGSFVQVFGPEWSIAATGAGAVSTVWAAG